MKSKITCGKRLHMGFSLLGFHLGMSGKEYEVWINWCDKTYPWCENHYFMCWGLWLNRKAKACRTKDLMTVYLQTMNGIWQGAAIIPMFFKSYTYLITTIIHNLKTRNIQNVHCLIWGSNNMLYLLISDYLAIERKSALIQLKLVVFCFKIRLNDEFPCRRWCNSWCLFFEMLVKHEY